VIDRFFKKTKESLTMFESMEWVMLLVGSGAFLIAILNVIFANFIIDKYF